MERIEPLKNQGLMSETGSPDHKVGQDIETRPLGKTVKESDAKIKSDMVLKTSPNFHRATINLQEGEKPFGEYVGDERGDKAADRAENVEGTVENRVHKKNQESEAVSNEKEFKKSIEDIKKGKGGE